MLARTCPDCGGSGERSCVTCSEGENAAGAGRVHCSYCGGSGTTGSDETRVCPRCKGQQTLACPSCFGRGHKNCRKVIRDKVCPRCRFSGRITCRTCEGKRWLNPAVLRARKAAPLKATSTATPSSATTRGASETLDVRRTIRDESDDAKPELAPIPELRTRFAKLAPRLDLHFELFANDLRLDARDFADDARVLERQVRRESSVALAKISEELESVIESSQRFVRRWSELQPLFVREYKAHENATRTWETYDKRSRGLTGSRLARLEKEYHGRLSTTTRIAESRTRELSEKNPEGLQADLKAMRLTVAELAKRSKRELKLAAAERKAAEAAAETDARSRDPAPDSGSAKRQNRRSSATGRSNGTKSRAAWITSANRSSQRDEDSGARAESRRDRSDRAAPKRKDDEADGGGGSFGPVVAAVVGFLVACGVFLLRGFFRGRLTG